MTNDLIPFSVDSLPAVAVEDLKDLSKQSDYLPRLQMYGCSADVVKEGKFPGGHWACVQGDELEDLGATVDIIPLNYRMKAIDFTGKDVVQYYDKESSGYKEVASKNGKGFMHGPVFIVLERTTGRLMELYFGSKSGRREAPKLRPFLEKRMPCTLSCRLKKGDNTYHVPVVSKCSEPFIGDFDAEYITSEVTKFMAPKLGPEIVAPEEAAKSGRAR